MKDKELMDISGKSILVIMPFYFEYEKKIKKTLVNMGADVCVINDDLFKENPIYHFLKAYNKKLYLKLANYVAQKQVALYDKSFEAILVIRGDSYSEQLHNFILAKYPKAMRIMYQWDSVERHPKALQIAQYFDNIYTFDKKDSISLGWKYRPLFFDERECCFSQERDVDIMFVGSLHSDRAKVIKELEVISKKNNLKLFSFVYCKFLTFIRQKYVKHNLAFQISLSKVSFCPMSINKMNELYNRTKCVIDFAAGDQSGLTMRTIEVLGHKCKLITNNKWILKEPFYNENNIMLVESYSDLENIVQFLGIEFTDIKEEIYNKYTIEQFVKDLFEGK